MTDATFPSLAQVRSTIGRTVQGHRLRHLLAQPREVTSPGGQIGVLSLCIGVEVGVLAGELAFPGDVTFGGFSMLAVICATWLLPTRRALLAFAASLATPVSAIELGAVNSITGRFQFAANLIAGVLTVLTVRAVDRSEVERRHALEGLQRFTADAAHELRSPLTTLRASLEVSLALSDDAATYRERSRALLGEVQRMIQVTEALLLLARDDAGAVALRMEPVDLSDLIAELCNRWRAAASQARISLQGPEDAKGSLLCDRALVGRLLDNLVENALRHTPPAGLVRLVGSADNRWCTVSVTDTGAGIPADFRPRMFERFSRADPGRDRESGGSGLGLALCHTIARLHGGSVTIDETTVIGTRIVLCLPVTPHLV